MLMTVFEEDHDFLIDFPVHINSNLPKLDRMGIPGARPGLNLSLYFRQLFLEVKNLEVEFASGEVVLIEHAGEVRNVHLGRRDR